MLELFSTLPKLKFKYKDTIVTNKEQEIINKLRFKVNPKERILRYQKNVYWQVRPRQSFNRYYSRNILKHARQ